MTQPPKLMTSIDHAPQSTADQNVDPMRQTPSPSAAALDEALSALMDDIEQAVQDQFDEARKDFADEIYPTDIIDSIREMLRNTDTLSKIAAQAVAAAQVKQHERGPNEKGRTFYEDPAVCLENMSEESIARIAWEAVCDEHCANIRCAGPKDDLETTCEMCKQIVRAVIRNQLRDK